MKQGGVSSRVALLLRSAELQPSLLDLSIPPLPPLSSSLPKSQARGSSMSGRPRVRLPRPAPSTTMCTCQHLHWFASSQQHDGSDCQSSTCPTLASTLEELGSENQSFTCAKPAWLQHLHLAPIVRALVTTCTGDDCDCSSPVLKSAFRGFWGHARGDNRVPSEGRLKPDV